MTDIFETPASAALDLAKWEEDHRMRAKIRADIRPANKAALFDALAAAGITEVSVTFDGYGDSGQIESINAKSGADMAALPDGTIDIATIGWRETEPSTEPMAIHDAIEHLAYECLGDTHCGWENNDGAFGDFVFNVESRTITLDYTERYTAHEQFEHEF